MNLKKIKEQPKKINTIETIFKIILKIKKIISKQKKRSREILIMEIDTNKI